MTPRRMLFGAAAPPFTPVIPSVLTTAPSAGWTQIPEPKATYYNGKTYFGYVNGSNGNVELRTFDHSTGVVSSPTVLHAALQKDTHVAPAVLVRSDGRIVCAYSGHHDATHLYVWISTNPEDISAGTETNIDSQFGSDTYTYCSLFQLSGESNKLYLFVRSQGGPGTTNYLQMSTSTDGGATWAFHADVFAHAGDEVYWKLSSNGVDRIDLVLSSDSNAPVGLGSLYHAYLTGGAWKKSDGSSAGSPTLDYTSLTQVYDGSTNPAWASDIITDGSTPRIVYMNSLSSNTDGAWCYARWSGSAWVNSTILASIGFGVVDPSPVACLDALQLNHCHLVRYISGHHEIWRYETADSGATWTGVAVTGGSSVDNIYPTAIKNHPAGLGVLFAYGTYVSDMNNSLGVAALTA